MKKITSSMAIACQALWWLYQVAHSSPISAAPNSPVSQSSGFSLRRSTPGRLPLCGGIACRYLAARGLDRVREQHRDRHRPDPARHGRDRTCDLLDRLEVDVPDELSVVAALG